jgi:iron(III) transport system substrate-binding protein
VFELMQAFVRTAAVWSAGLLLLAGACGPTTATNQGASGSRATQPTGSQGTTPASTAAGAAATEWAQTVARANQEGKVVVLGPPGADAREALTVPFQSQYPGIQVDYTGGAGSQTAPKVLNERQAGQYLADLYVGGTTTPVVAFMPLNALDDINGYLVGPDITPAAWRDGRLDYTDEAGQYNVVFTSYVKAPIGYNPQQVAATDLRSYKDLLDPKWRGKISMLDPSLPQAQGAGTFFYATPGLGPAFIKDLFANGVTFSKDDRQILDWVARGQYPLTLTASDLAVAELKKKGITIELLPSEALAEGTYLTAGFGSVSVIDRAPHPNATKVYLNWLLSQEGQTAWSRASGYPSRRLDVPTDHLADPALIPKPGVAYQENYKERYQLVFRDIQAYMLSVLPR